MDNLQIIEEFSRHYCVVCRKKIMVCCGTPVIHIGGCCSRIDDEENKTIYVRTLKSHFHCYIEAKTKSKQKRLETPEVKLNWTLEEVKEVVKCG